MFQMEVRANSYVLKSCYSEHASAYFLSNDIHIELDNHVASQGSALSC